MQQVVPMFLDSSSGGGGGGPLALLFVAALVGGIVLYVKNRRPYQAETHAALPVEVALQSVVQAYAMAGWMVTSQAWGSASFTKRKKANALIAIFLLFCFIIPGVVYLVLAGRILTASVNANATGMGTAAVRFAVNMRGFGGKASVQRALQALPQVPANAMTGDLVQTVPAPYTVA